MPPSVLIICALAVGGCAIFWMWRRVREARRTSADDYVAQARARAQAELRAVLRKPDE